MSETTTHPAVRMRRIVKKFGPVEVLKSVDFEIHHGEVHALAGENGAGKSTLMKVLQGVHQITDGEIEVDGELVMIRDTQDAENYGIGMVFQEFSLVPSMTVAQNIFLNRELRGKFGFVSDRLAEKEAERIFQRMGVSVDPSAEVRNLGTGYWQLVEIAKALAKNAKVLVMDEPTASLAKHEVDHLFALIETLTAQGIAIVYISHRMDEIRRVADRITVLRDGRVAMVEKVSEVDSGQIIEAIIGRGLGSQLVYQDRERDYDAPILLQVDHLSSGSGLSDVSLETRAGEIVGLAGLMGSGRTELARVLGGIDRSTSGTVRIAGREVGFSNPSQAHKEGVALIPEDRREQGLVLQHSVTDNLTLPMMHELMTGPLLSPRKTRRMTDQLVHDYEIKVSDVDAPISQLSGGNQQKVVIAKWMNTKPRVLVMDEPTSGVDIGTKTEILEMVRTYAGEGNAVIFISSELPELLAVSDRVVVLREGQTFRTLERSEIEGEEQLQLIIQGEAA